MNVLVVTANSVASRKATIVVNKFRFAQRSFKKLRLEHVKTYSADGSVLGLAACTRMRIRFVGVNVDNDDLVCYGVKENSQVTIDASPRVKIGSLSLSQKQFEIEVEAEDSNSRLPETMIFEFTIYA